MRPPLALAVLCLALACPSCVEFNAECSPPIDRPELVLTYLSDPLPVAHDVVRSRESALGDAMADAYLAALQQGAGEHPQVAVENAGAIRDLGLCLTRTQLARGPLTRRVLKDTVPFSNQLVTVKLSERQLFDILEHGVASVAVPGVSPGGQFLQVAGLSYEVDCSNRPEQLSNLNGAVVRDATGTRVVALTLGTRRITREASTASPTIVVALNSFLAGAGDNFVDFKETTATATERYTYNVLEEFLSGLGATASAPARLLVDPQKPRIVLRNCE